MPFIPIIEEPDAEGALADAYREVRMRGRVPAVLKVQGARPKVLRAHLELHREVMGGPSELSRVERETVAVAVSAANGCRF